jgi:hypothetical protein
MNKIVILAFAVLTCSTQAQSLIPPEHPIRVVTEIGELDSMPDRLRITVNSTVTTNQITTLIQIDNAATSDPKLTVDPVEVPAFLELLETACSKLSPSQGFTAKAGRLSVSVGGPQGQSRLLLNFDAASATDQAQHFTVETRYATQLIRNLARSKQVADWFNDKLKLIQPTPILH